MRYPRVFFQPATHTTFTGVKIHNDRIRILYPDGTSEWLADGNSDHQYPPCWSRDSIETTKANTVFWSGVGKDKSYREAVKRMNAYDESHGWPKAVMIGELK